LIGAHAGLDHSQQISITSLKQEHVDKELAMQKITPFLWFDDQAEEAANFYVSIFRNSWILSVS